MHNKTKNYKIKLKPISPIHIGTGEAYEPMNYVIDRGADDKYYMYVFDEFEFFKKLDEKSKDEFMKIMDHSSNISLLKLQSFIKNRMALAKNLHYRKILVSKDFGKEYIEKAGKIVQIEKDAKENINKLVVEKTFISPNLNKAIIPGSSLKGAIATAFWEMKVIDDEQQYNDVKKIMSATNKKNPFFNLLISDSKIIKSSIFIDIAKNIKRNKISKDGLSVVYEA
ncbi:RAMP superfamily CRISPR-associated protein, partial [Campylobacter concisus]